MDGMDRHYKEMTLIVDFFREHTSHCRLFDVFSPGNIYGALGAALVC
jgi:hypothetical protein